MRNHVLALFALAVAAGPVLASGAPAYATLGPQELMQKVSQDMLRDLTGNREALRKDPAQVRALVDRHLLPYFDTDFAARLVLGKHWRTATDQQRQRFIDAF